MQAEYQSPESRTAAIDGSYSYTESVGHSLGRSERTNAAPSEFFRYRMIKRCCDVFLVLISMPVMLPILGAVSTVVMLSSPGPIFYSHRRIRKSGAFFSMWKFRTMCVNSAEVLDDYLRQHPKAHTEWNETHKLRKDPRITPLGGFLRRYSLDELPQLWNVLVGQMSLVGPRPIVAAEVEKYGDYFECYCRVKPGLTGLWQVSDRADGNLEVQETLDTYYIRNWSLWLDLYILARTVRAVLFPNGAY